MAKLLVCAQSYPYPADQGGRIRYAHLLEALERAHEVRLVLVRRASDADRFPARNAVDVPFSSARLALNSARSLLSSSPMQFGAFVDRRSGAAVAKLARDAEAFVAFEPRAGMHYRYLPNELPRVMDLPDSLVLAARAQWTGHRGLWVKGLENLLKVRRLEAELVRAFDIVSVAGPTDARWISERFPESDPRVVPTAIDVLDDVGPPPQDPRVVFTGDLSFAPNADAVRFLVSDVWPLVLRSAPRARLEIVGHEPDSKLRRFLARTGCETAYSVPDMTPHLRRARVVVAPMRIGSGIKVKVLTAMAAGRPVVVTPSANSGIEAEPDREILIGSDAVELAGQIVRLLDDEALAARIGAAGRELVAKRFSPTAASAGFLDAVRDVLERPAAHGSSGARRQARQ